jgi:YHS domain-containing protein
MMRFIAFVVLVFALSLLIRSFFFSATQKKRGPAVISDMVKDPNCGTYIPKETAIVKVIHGTSHYFCSTACAEEFSKK